MAACAADRQAIQGDIFESTRELPDKGRAGRGIAADVGVARDRQATNGKAGTV